MRHPFRRKYLRARLLPLYGAVAAVVFFADPAPRGAAAGALLVAAGLLLRAWGAGHLVKTDRLTVSGPYAHLRHPLYLGTLLVATGFLVCAGGAVTVAGEACLLPLFFGYYLPYKDRIESARLERRFGPAYGAYRAAVPALLPSLSPWRPPPVFGVDRDRRWSAARFRDNSEAGVLVAAAAVLALLALRPVLAP